MTASASYLTLKFVMRHDELKNVNHKVLLGALVSGTQIRFLGIRLNKVGQVGVTQPCICALSHEIPGGGAESHLNYKKNRPTGIRNPQ